MWEGDQLKITGAYTEEHGLPVDASSGDARSEYRQIKKTYKYQSLRVPSDGHGCIAHWVVEMTTGNRVKGAGATPLIAGATECFNKCAVTSRQKTYKIPKRHQAWS